MSITIYSKELNKNLTYNTIAFYCNDYTITFIPIHKNFSKLVHMNDIVEITV